MLRKGLAGLFFTLALKLIKIHQSSTQEDKKKNIWIQSSQSSAPTLAKGCELFPGYAIFFFDALYKI